MANLNPREDNGLGLKLIYSLIDFIIPVPVTYVRIGLFQKKTKQAGLRIWNFEGYQRNSMWNFQRLIKSEVEFPRRVTEKKNSGNSRGLHFWAWNFLVSNTISWNFQGWNFVLSGISRDRLKKWKIPGGNLNYEQRVWVVILSL